MHSFRRGFGLADMMTAIVLCVLVLFYANAMIGCGGGVSSNQAQMQSLNQARGIHSGLVLFAMGNKNFYPGLDFNGMDVNLPLVATRDTYGYAGTDGTHVAYRMAILLRGNLISPESLISPAERNKGIKAVKPGEALVDGGSYSYAMLNISNRTSGRRGEWRLNNNKTAPIITDRNIGTGDAGKDTQSLHTRPGGGWAGSVAYNDNHAKYETSDVLRTEYAKNGEVATDHLFKDTDKTASGTADADAAMVFKADGRYVNQQP